MPSHHTSWISILILSSHLCLGLKTYTAWYRLFKEAKLCSSKVCSKMYLTIVVTECPYFLAHRPNKPQAGQCRTPNNAVGNFAVHYFQSHCYIATRISCDAVTGIESFPCLMEIRGLSPWPCDLCHLGVC